uniref:Uncharacterized protein n=1 Tax=Anguilla anguilla TaxID=7936 RepID=A0A0E9TDA5_ANGAN
MSKLALMMILLQLIVLKTPSIKLNKIEFFPLPHGLS